MPFRNTISAVWQSFFAYMQELAQGQTPPVTAVIEGETTPHQQEHPFASLQVTSTKVAERAGQDKLWTVACRVRITATSPGDGGGTAAILAAVAIVNDKIEAYAKPDGVAGFEDMVWSITSSLRPDEGNILIADSTVNWTVMVTRGGN